MINLVWTERLVYHTEMHNSANNLPPIQSPNIFPPMASCSQVISALMQMAATWNFSYGLVHADVELNNACNANGCMRFFSVFFCVTWALKVFHCSSFLISKYMEKKFNWEVQFSTRAKDGQVSDFGCSWTALKVLNRPALSIDCFAIFFW